MFQFLQPIWLFALTGLSIPVIIHLWNQRPGKILRVGSIALVAANAVAHKKSIRLTEILLLILRCLLLTCIAFALANPVWKSESSNHAKGWVLMNRQQAKDAYGHFQPLVDSLLQAGMEFHYFEKDFAKADIQKAIQSTADTTATQLPSYRATIALLNQQADPQMPLYVFTDNYLSHFGGYRTSVSLNLHWFTFTPDSSNSQRAIDTSTACQVTLFAGSHANDANYLIAALDAIRQFSNRNIIVKLAASVADVPKKQNWLCWLADEAIPSNIQADNILQYATGKPVSASSYILPAAFSSFEAIPLYRVIADSAIRQDDDILWKDGFGRPLLTRQKKGSSAHYQLHTHIDPAWSELPWSEHFPQLLYALLYLKPSSYPKTAVANNIMIDKSQLLPAMIGKQSSSAKPVLFPATKLNSLFWLLAFIFFFAERCLSFYHRKTVGNA